MLDMGRGCFVTFLGGVPLAHWGCSSLPHIPQRDDAVPTSTQCRGALPAVLCLQRRAASDSLVVLSAVPQLPRLQVPQAEGAVDAAGDNLLLPRPSSAQQRADLHTRGLGLKQRDGWRSLGDELSSGWEAARGGLLYLFGGARCLGSCDRLCSRLLPNSDGMEVPVPRAARQVRLSRGGRCRRAPRNAGDGPPQPFAHLRAR